ncbi:MAG: class B sortase [Solobacterium sp.]|nr:class B sortase [Solobacterium sp.]
MIAIRSRGLDIVLSVLVAGTLFFFVFQSCRIIRELLEYESGGSVYAGLAETAHSETDSPGVQDSAGIDFAGLAEINPDIIGWITMPDTVIDYPVVQGRDNDYYLDHLFDKTENRSGCVFVNSENSPDFSDKNTVMYAHHMRNGTMFADLEKYRDQAWADGHAAISLVTPAGSCVIRPFAAVEYAGKEQIIQTAFTGYDDFADYVQDLKNRSVFQTDLEVHPADRIVTMQTCTYGIENGRFAVFGILEKIE